MSDDNEIIEIEEYENNESEIIHNADPRITVLEAEIEELEFEQNDISDDIKDKYEKDPDIKIFDGKIIQAIRVLLATKIIAKQEALFKLKHGQNNAQQANSLLRDTNKSARVEFKLASGSDALTPEAKEGLTRIIKVLNANGGVPTNEDGERFNKYISYISNNLSSQRELEAINNELKSLSGVDESMIEIEANKVLQRDAVRDTSVLPQIAAYDQNIITQNDLAIQNISSTVETDKASKVGENKFAIAFQEQAQHYRTLTFSLSQNDKVGVVLEGDVGIKLTPTTGTIANLVEGVQAGKKATGNQAIDLTTFINDKKLHLHVKATYDTEKNQFVSQNNLVGTHVQDCLDKNNKLINLEPLAEEAANVMKLKYALMDVFKQHLDGEFNKIQRELKAKSKELTKARKFDKANAIDKLIETNNVIKNGSNIEGQFTEGFITKGNEALQKMVESAYIMSPEERKNLSVEAYIGIEAAEIASKNYHEFFKAVAENMSAEKNPQLLKALAHHTDENRISASIRRAVNGFRAAVLLLSDAHKFGKVEGNAEMQKLTRGQRFEKILKSLNQTSTEKKLVKEIHKAKQKAMPFRLFAKTAALIAQRPFMKAGEKDGYMEDLHKETKRLSEMDSPGEKNRPRK